MLLLTFAFTFFLDPGELVAGEFGAVCGRNYTSFSGFYRKQSAGSVILTHKATDRTPYLICIFTLALTPTFSQVQIALTAQVLKAAGFAYWDMGQEHAYKLSYGANLLPRDVFLDLFRAERARSHKLETLIEQHSDGFRGDAWLSPSRARRSESASPHATGEVFVVGESTASVRF